MEGKRKKIPIGVEDFADFSRMNYYYVDKTGLIKELLENQGKVNLFTRPRRFGKSINMSMLKYFFEIGTDKSLFDGLKIVEETDLCAEYMGRFPVIFVSLKQVSGETFQESVQNLWTEISREAGRFDFLVDSDRLSRRDKINYEKICDGSGNLDASLKHLSEMLYKYYGERAIILIDEYDAPLQKAYDRGYYEKMVRAIRQIFGYALKTNDYLYFGILTGCMRVSKESLFSDLNNPKLYTLIDEECDEWFGFTDQEVQKLLSDFNLSNYYQVTKDWYDGYRIGITDIYCPWDVTNWCNQLLMTSDTSPRNYWANVGENSIIYRFAEKSGDADRYELEVLSQGGFVDKKLSFELTYKDIDSSIDNLWSVLFTTGYLTQRGRNEDDMYRLAIPNQEVNRVFADQVQKWFMETMEGGLQELYRAFEDGDTGEIEKCITLCLKESISFMDGGNTEEQKESWYHAFVAGMAKGRRGWIVKSNREAGKGRSDIALIDRRKSRGIIIEVKHTNDEEELQAKADEAGAQIRDLNYNEFFLGFQIGKIEEYGISFCGKECRVVKNKK